MAAKVLGSVSAITFLVATSGALAADLPTRAAAPVYVPPPPVFSWTGAYAGANVGYVTNLHASRDSCVDNVGAPFGGACQVVPAFSLNGDGVIGGGQIGYNYQISQFVLGGEADFAGTSLHASRFVPGPFAFANPANGVAPASTYVASESLAYLGTARLRIGYLVTDRLLAYATAGLAYGRTNLQATLISPGSATYYVSGQNKTYLGYAVGGGLEYALTDHFSIKAEALYADLGTRTTYSTEVPPTFTPQNFQHNGVFPLDFVTGRIGLNYKFGSPATPVIARY